MTDIENSMVINAQDEYDSLVDGDDEIDPYDYADWMRDWDEYVDMDIDPLYCPEQFEDDLHSEDYDDKL